MPVRVLWVFTELAKLLIEIQPDVEIQIMTFIVFENQRDSFAMHICIFHCFPSYNIDELCLFFYLRPVSVQKRYGLLRKGF